jgi:hypothetical protein
MNSTVQHNIGYTALANTTDYAHYTQNNPIVKEINVIKINIQNQNANKHTIQNHYTHNCIHYITSHHDNSVNVFFCFFGQ